MVILRKSAPIEVAGAKSSDSERCELRSRTTERSSGWLRHVDRHEVCSGRSGAANEVRGGFATMFGLKKFCISSNAVRVTPTVTPTVNPTVTPTELRHRFI